MHHRHHQRSVDLSLFQPFSFNFFPKLAKKLITRNQMCCVSRVCPGCSSSILALTVIPQCLKSTPSHLFKSSVGNTRPRVPRRDPSCSPVLVLSIGLEQFCFSDFLHSSCFPFPSELAFSFLAAEGGICVFSKAAPT